MSFDTASTLTGFETASQTARISSTVAQPGRVEHVGAGPLVGLQARDRVVEVVGLPRMWFSARAVSVNGKPSSRAASAAAATRSTAWSKS